MRILLFITLLYSWALATRRGIAILFTVMLILLVFSRAPLASEAVKPKVLILYDHHIGFNYRQCDVFRNLLSGYAQMEYLFVLELDLPFRYYI